jgi:hypothetical protein
MLWTLESVLVCLSNIKSPQICSWYDHVVTYHIPKTAKLNILATTYIQLVINAYYFMLINMYFIITSKQTMNCHHSINEILFSVIRCSGMSPIVVVL